MSRHTILKTTEGKNIGVVEIYSPNEDAPAVFPSVLTDRLLPTDPVATSKPKPFFRTSGGKQQFCVRFSSGEVQIIATEV